MGDGFCLPGGSLMFLFRLLEMTSCLSSHQRQALLKLVEKVLGRSVYWQAARQVGVAQVSDQADLGLSSGVKVWWGWGGEERGGMFMRGTQWDNVFKRSLGTMRFYYRWVPLGSSTIRQVKYLFRSLFSHL